MSSEGSMALENTSQKGNTTEGRYKNFEPDVVVMSGRGGKSTQETAQRSRKMLNLGSWDVLVQVLIQGEGEDHDEEEWRVFVEMEISSRTSE